MLYYRPITQSQATGFLVSVSRYFERVAEPSSLLGGVSLWASFRCTFWSKLFL